MSRRSRSAASVAVRFSLLERRDARLELLRALGEGAAELLRLGAQLAFGNTLKPLVPFVDLVDDGLNAPSLPFVAGTNYRIDQAFQHQSSSDISHRAR